MSSGHPIPPELREKFAATMGSRWWRVNNLYPIVNAQARVEKLRLNWAQAQLFREFHFRNQVLKVRKLGISTYVAIGIILDSCLFNKNTKAAIIDETEDDAKKKLAMIKFAWDHLADEQWTDTRLLALWLQNNAGLRLTTESKTELAWSNGSTVYADVSMRGDTPQILHVSELGAIAANKPERAQAIVSGSFNSVAMGNIIIAESTHKGGRFGVNYDYIKMAMNARGRALTPLDWKFFFFPWHREPKYALELPRNYTLSLTQKQRDYFAAIERQYETKLTPQQKFWWVTMSEQPHADMAHEFPGSAMEALSATTEGAIYGEQMTALRAAGRIRDFAPEAHAPLYTFWDIGMSDFTGIWLLQFAGRDKLALNYRTGWMETIASYAVTLAEWERRYERPIVRHFVPHDAGAHKSMDGKTTLDLMREAGIRNVVTVPRTPDKSVGIKHLRALLPSFVFHATDCDVEKKVGDRRFPSGLGALEGYKYAPQAAGGTIKLEPVHDDASNGCVVAGTMINCRRGMIPVELVRAGDEVWTPAGWALVSWAGETKQTAGLIRTTFDNGESIETTPEHKFIGPSGVTKADALRMFAVVWTRDISPSLSFLTGFGIGYRAATTLLPLALARSTVLCIARFGRRLTERFRPSITFITRTVIRLIIVEKISRALRRLPISVPTLATANGTAAVGMSMSCLRRPYRHPRIGIEASPEGRGIETTAKKHGPNESPSSGPVFAAESRFKPWLITKFFAADYVNSDFATVQSRRNWSSRAWYVGKILWTRLSATARSIVRQRASGRRIVSIEKIVLPVAVPVYDLTVERHHCYFANGVLVSNSDALRTYAEADLRRMIDVGGVIDLSARAVGVGVTRAESERKTEGFVTVNGGVPQLRAQAVR